MTNFPSGSGPAQPAAGHRKPHTADALLHRDWQIAGLAQELERPIEDVAPVYDEIFKRLAARAKVTDYLPALVIKNLRAHFANS